ncbi:MAG: hypothetical protein O3A55_07970 [Bacteroidetes bacterium]|nr:hypothetical protein [Bacteroidota bacterium]
MQKIFNTQRIEETIYICETTNKLLNNMGGPISRSRTEDISSNILLKEKLISKTEIYDINIWVDDQDIEKLLINCAQKFGWKTLEEASKYLNLPKEKYLILNCTNNQNKKIKLFSKVMLKHVLILSKCNHIYYHPTSPIILTKNRLSRCIKLIKIDINKYYDME